MDILPSVAGIDSDTAILGLLYMLVLILGTVATAIISALLFLCLMLVIGAFTVFGIDLCKNLEEFFDQRKQNWLATAANSMAKAVSEEDEKQKQVIFLNKKKALLQEGRVLAQRDVYQAEEIKDLEEIEDLGNKSIPSQQEKLEKHRQKSKEASDLLFKNWRQYKDLLHECPGGAWIREDERNQSRRQTSQEEKTACKYRKGCCAFSCGCCEKNRAVTGNQRERPAMYLYSHCTSECSCCFRRESRIFSCEQ
ncbi:hypothetical protein N7494_000958 [Penicillium frequentans]|uniref:Uncharacterized protein n=1 Tax=Penicillium frequentans TaxID=3151616 RepID=A0AAD6GLT6_9EURO|nr:hypothetical protein N7494_000958 [Penicillium glabrum]